MFQIITLIALVILLMVQEALHYRQIQDLTLKLKAKSTEEFVVAKQQLEAPTPKAEDAVQAATSLEDLDPGEALKVLKKNLEEDEEELKEE